MTSVPTAAAPPGVVARRPTGAGRLRESVEALPGAARAVLVPVSELGWALAAGVAGSWVIGLAYGWVEVLIAAVTGTVLLVLASGFLLGRAPHAAELELSAERVVAGERAPGRVVVTNPTKRRLLPSRVELRVGSSVAAFDVPALAAGDSHDELFLVPTKRRGVIEVGPLSSVRGDPLGLLRREHAWTTTRVLYVHPRTLPLRGSAAGFIKDLEGQTTRELSNHDVSFHALREYVPGDDRRYIHWRTTARTGKLMVRQFEETRRSHLAVVQSLSRADYGDGADGEEEFELAVSVAGSLGRQALRDEHTLSMLTSIGPRVSQRTASPLRRLRTTSAPRLLDDLAGIDMVGGAAPVDQLVRATIAEIAGISVAVIICGSTVSVSSVRAAALHFPSDVRVVAVRCEPGGVSRVRVVGDVTIVTSGALDELPRLIHRAGAL